MVLIQVIISLMTVCGMIISVQLIRQLYIRRNQVEISHTFIDETHQRWVEDGITCHEEYLECSEDQLIQINSIIWSKNLWRIILWHLHSFSALPSIKETLLISHCVGCVVHRLKYSISNDQAALQSANSEALFHDCVQPNFTGSKIWPLWRI